MIIDPRKLKMRAGYIEWDDNDNYQIYDCYSSLFVDDTYFSDSDSDEYLPYRSDIYFSDLPHAGIAPGWLCRSLRNYDYKIRIRVYYRGNPDYIPVLRSTNGQFIIYDTNRIVDLEYKRGHLRGIYNVEKIINDLPKYSAGEKLGKVDYPIEYDILIRYQ